MNNQSKNTQTWPMQKPMGIGSMVDGQRVVIMREGRTLCREGSPLPVPTENEMNDELGATKDEVIDDLRDIISDLRKEIGRVNQARETALRQTGAMMAARDREIAANETLRTANAALAKDAARYRFWRKRYGSKFVLMLPSAELRFDGYEPKVELAMHDYEPKVDAAIDAAIDSQQEPTK